VRNSTEDDSDRGGNVADRIECLVVTDDLQNVRGLRRSKPATGIDRNPEIAPVFHAQNGGAVNEVGASVRTLSRLFVADTGMTFRQWQRQARLLAALVRLAQREPVTRVALDLGYDSPSAFIHAFRRALGTTPRRYFSSPDPIARARRPGPRNGRSDPWAA